MEGAVGRRRPPWASVLAALAACAAASLAAGLLYPLQVRSGFVPPEDSLDLTRPDAFVLPGSGAVGPSDLGYLRWDGERPLRLRMEGLGAPRRLFLKLLPECSDATLAVRVDGEAVAELALEPRWTRYELEPAVSGDTLGLTLKRPLGAGAAPCPVHLSGIRTTAVVRGSGDFPRFWAVRPGPGPPPPPAGRSAAWIVAAALLVTACGAAAVRPGGPGGPGGPGRLTGWLLLVGPGVVLLAISEILVRAADLRLVYPPSSFPALLLLPGLAVLAWRHREALLERVRPPLGWLRARPVLVVGLLALLVWGWIVADVASEQFGGDLRGLVRFGERFGTAELFPGLKASTPSGYDGQFYAVLATDPFLTDPGTADRLDSPAYRATRILVPFLAWTLALGHPATAIWTYVGLCWLLSLATVPLVGRWLEESGGSPWWAALLVLDAGLVASLLQVTLDGAALFFLLLALAAWRRERTAWAALAATAAALTREVFVLGGLALAAVELRRRRWTRAAAQGLPPVLALGLWRLRVAAIADASVQPLAHNFALPFRWVPDKLGRLAELWTSRPEWHHAEVAGLLALALAVAAAVRLLPRAGRDPAVLTLAAFAALALFLSGAVYQEIHAHARVLAPLPVLALALSGDPGLPPATRWWLRGPAALSALAGYWLVSLAT